MASSENFIGAREVAAERQNISLKMPVANAVEVPISMI